MIHCPDIYYFRVPKGRFLNTFSYFNGILLRGDPGGPRKIEGLKIALYAV